MVYFLQIVVLQAALRTPEKYLEPLNETKICKKWSISNSGLYIKRLISNLR